MPGLSLEDRHAGLREWAAHRAANKSRKTQHQMTLTFTTGIVDAASYLGLGRVFSANMTGNVVLLGFGIAGGAHPPVVAPLVSLGAFVLGAGAGGRLAQRLSERRPSHLATALAIEVGLTRRGRPFGRGGDGPRRRVLR